MDPPITIVLISFNKSYSQISSVCHTKNINLSKIKSITLKRFLQELSRALGGYLNCMQKGTGWLCPLSSWHESLFPTSPSLIQRLTKTKKFQIYLSDFKILITSIQ